MCRWSEPRQPGPRSIKKHSMCRPESDSHYLGNPAPGNSLSIQERSRAFSNASGTLHSTCRADNTDAPFHARLPLCAFLQALTTRSSHGRVGQQRRRSCLPRLAVAREFLKFLRGIMTELKRSRLVVANGDPRRLCPHSPRQRDFISGHLSKAIDGPLAAMLIKVTSSMTHIGAAAELPTVWMAVRASLRRVLEVVTIADRRRLSARSDRRSGVGISSQTESRHP